MKILALTVLALTISSCATLNKEECERANWNTLGSTDGRKGHTTSRLSSHQKACGEHGINVDVTAYNAGYQSGLITFCTLENGFEQGKAGKSNKHVCPSKLQAKFDRGHSQGHQIYTIKKSISLAEKKIEDIEKEIEATYKKEELEGKSYASKRSSLASKRRTEERRLRKYERELNLITTTALIKKLL